MPLYLEGEKVVVLGHIGLSSRLFDSRGRSTFKLLPVCRWYHTSGVKPRLLREKCTLPLNRTFVLNINFFVDEEILMN